jgi:hypothetical protein
MIEFLTSQEWGFILLDEGHSRSHVPVCRYNNQGTLEARSNLYILPFAPQDACVERAERLRTFTATLVREDDNNWMVLAKGHIADIQMRYPLSYLIKVHSRIKQLKLFDGGMSEASLGTPV